MRPAHITLVLITLIGLTGASGMVFVIYGAWKGVAGPRGDAQLYAREAVHAICKHWSAAELRAHTMSGANEQWSDSKLNATMRANESRFGSIKEIHGTRASAPLYSKHPGTTIEVTLDCRFAKLDHQRVRIWCNEQNGKWQIARISFPE